MTHLVGHLDSLCLALVVDLLGRDRLTRCSALELGVLVIGFPVHERRTLLDCNLIFRMVAERFCVWA